MRVKEPEDTCNFMLVKEQTRSDLRKMSKSVGRCRVYD